MTSKAAKTARLHAHFENLTSKPPVFHITRERLTSAMSRHADVAKNIHITHGSDLKELHKVLPKVEVLVTSYDVLTHDKFPFDTLAEAAPRLKWIFLSSAGIEKLLPLDWLPPGVKLINARGAHRKKAAEFAQMSLLMLNIQLPRMVTNQKNAHWNSIFTSSIAGRTLCLVGLGNLGSVFAAQAKRLGMKVIGVRRTGKPHRHVDRMLPLAKLKQAFAAADFVVLTAPLTGDTKHLVGDKEFAAMKPGTMFMNVGRGGVIDTAALIRSLRSGHLGGAILDVYPQEPLPGSHPLWKAPNLIMIPHVAMDDIDRFLSHCLDIAFENLRRTLAGRPLRNVVRPSLGY